VKRPSKFMIVGVALAMAVTACGGGKQATGSTDTLTVNMAFGRGVVTQDFNPFSTTATEGTLGFVFEPLMGVNILNNDVYTPWLASAEHTSADGRTLTVGLDPRATWNDGSPVTADDVVFTFQLLKQYPAANFQYAAEFATVAAKDAHTVVFTFSGPGFTQVSNILQEYIVPAKYWRGKNPLTWTNPNPVGSGAYKESRLVPQQLTLVARTDYWRQKSIDVKQINFPVVGSNATAEVANLKNGTEDWSGGAIPNVMTDYVGRNPTYDKAWFPTYGALFLFFNLDRPKFQNVHVRKAIELAVDKAQLITLVKQVGASPISQTGLDPGTQSAWLDPAYSAAVKTDQTRAKAELAQAGYTYTGGRMVDRNGAQLSFSITEEADFTDSIQRDELIANQLGQIGIKATVTPEGSTLFNDDKQKGNFDAITGGFAYGATPWSMYNALLNSAYAGTASGGAASYDNYERYRDPATDALLSQFSTAATTAQQISLAKQLEKTVVDDVPFVTLANITAGCEYTTRNWTGWPSASDPYAICSPWIGGPYNEQVVLNLKPAS
jgi:peptide/nickel transport system substrate-binding protein